MRTFFKTMIACAVLSLAYTTATSQYLRTAYFMDKAAPMRMSLNPALIPDQGYLTIPLIGSINASYTSNSLSLGNVFYQRDGKLVTFLDERVGVDEFLKNLKKHNQVNVDLNYDLFQAGWWANNGFWTIGMSLRTNVSAGIPKTMFEFIKRGNGLEGTTYDISNLRVRADVYTETSVGYSRPIDDRLTVGGRLKILEGFGNADMKFKKLHARMTEDEWHITSTGELYASVNGLEFKMSEDENIDPSSGMDREYVDGVDLDGFGLAGFGVGIDVGASYRILDNLTVSASVLDLGFIAWSGKSTRYAVADGDFTFDGFNIPVNDDNATSVSDQLDDLKDDLERLFHFNERDNKGGRATMLCATLVLGGEYTILDNQLGFGVLSTTRFYRPRAYTELTASVNYRPVYWFAATLSYSMIHSNFSTYGMALNFSPRGFNFFIGSDYMITKVNPQFIPVNARAENVYFGMSVPIGKKRNGLAKTSLSKPTRYNTDMSRFY